MTDLNSIRTEHEHDTDRTVVLDVPEGKTLVCHECESPIAEDCEDGQGWRWV